MCKVSYHKGSKDSKKQTSDKSRFKEPFYTNYDLYDVGDTGPGSGFFSNMQNYDSIKDFLNEKRKSKKSKKSNRRIDLLKLSFDFPLENQVIPILGDGEALSSMMGGFGDQYFETKDFEGKTPDNLDYTRPEGFDEFVEKLSDDKFVGIISQLINSPSESLIGLPDGVSNDDKESAETKSPNYYDKVREFFPGHSVVF